MPKAPLPHPPPKTIDRHECCCKESERLQHYPQAAQGGFPVAPLNPFGTQLVGWLLMQGFAGGFAVAPCTPSPPLRKWLGFSCKAVQGALRSPPAPLRLPLRKQLGLLCKAMQGALRSPPAPLRTPFGSGLASHARLCRGLCGRSATSIVASCACSFRLRRFASPLEKQSRPWRPINSNQRFEYDRLVRGRNLRHRRKSAHLPLHPFATPSEAACFVMKVKN